MIESSRKISFVIPALNEEKHIGDVIDSIIRNAKGRYEYEMIGVVKKNNLKKYDRRMLSIRTLKYKHIWTSDGNDEFYDLEDDPDENLNIINTIDLNNFKEILDKYLPKFENCYQKNKHLLD